MPSDLPSTLFSTSRAQPDRLFSASERRDGLRRVQRDGNGRNDSQHARVGAERKVGLETRDRAPDVDGHAVDFVPGHGGDRGVGGGTVDL